MRSPLRNPWVPPLALAAAALAACDGAAPGAGAEAGATTLVFRHFEVPGGGAPIAALLAEFERAHPGVHVVERVLPSSSDQQHQVYATDLEAGAADFDVLALDVVWVAEFARAGWLLPVAEALADEERAAFLPGPLEAVAFRGELYALPWFVDAGLLYYRADLLGRLGRAPPREWEELAEGARAAVRAGLVPYGHVFQGKQYEGLVCDALEIVWSHGGELPGAGIAAERAGAALAFLRSLPASGASPGFVSTLTEEPSRVVFGQGRALFLRNWPYAWSLLEREGSAVRGKVGVAPLPSAPGHAPAATLGGWLLGVNAHSRRAEAAERLVAFLASPHAQKALVVAYGYSPPRPALFDDAEVAAAQPFLASLRGVYAAARPRPVFPAYVALSQVMQAELSGVLVGSRAPRAAVAAIGRAAARLGAR